MPRTPTWTGDAEKELIMALWRSASTGPVRPDWTKAAAIMESRGFGFTLEAMRCRWKKKLMKELYSLDEPGSAAKASPGRKRKRVVDDGDDDGDAPPSTPKKPITTGLQTPDSKKAKTSKSGGGAMAIIKQEPVDIPGVSDHEQQQDELSPPEPSPTARARVRRSNPGRSATKAQSYKEWSGEDSANDGSANDESFGDDSDVAA